jgi:23S rRNA pseudouridine2605 synthase
MTSSNENDSSPVVNSSAAPTNSEGTSSQEGGAKPEGREGGERRPRRQGSGKHPFNKKRTFNKDKPRREGDSSGAPREGGGNQSAKLAPNPADIEALFASVVSGEFDAALDAPEALESKNPDGLDESAISHQTGAERRAQRAQL